MSHWQLWIVPIVGIFGHHLRNMHQPRIPLWPPWITASQEEGVRGQRTTLAPTDAPRYRQAVQDLRTSLEEKSSDATTKTHNVPIQATRFVPLRMEVLMGGPGSPGGPRRLEWKRDQSHGWSPARAILPFSPPNAIASPQVLHRRSITIALTGTHCSGKSTIAQRLADILGWTYQRELGDVLRDDSNIVRAGHCHGDGSGVHNQVEWDEKIRLAELKRDEESIAMSRVVETWHVGNLVWKSFRRHKQGMESDWDATWSAIRTHDAHSLVIMVHLSVPVEVSIRRHQSPENSKRLPMENDEKECTELHTWLEGKTGSYFSNLSDLGVPTKTVENSEDGDQAMEDTVRRIVRFVNEVYWKSGLPSGLSK